MSTGSLSEVPEIHRQEFRAIFEISGALSVSVCGNLFEHPAAGRRLHAGSFSQKSPKIIARSSGFDLCSSVGSLLRLVQDVLKNAAVARCLCMRISSPDGMAEGHHVCMYRHMHVYVCM